MQETVWAKSSYSLGENNCVEVGKTEGQPVAKVRDTKDRGRGHIEFGAQAWQAFVRL